MEVWCCIEFLLKDLKERPDFPLPASVQYNIYSDGRTVIKAQTCPGIGVPNIVQESMEILMQEIVNPGFFQWVDKQAVGELVLVWLWE